MSTITCIKKKSVSHSTILRWLYMSSINVDGNFELEHMNMKHPEADISLSNGEAFMVESSNYHYHLGIGRDNTEVWPISYSK